MAEVRCARRHYLLSALSAERSEDLGLASAWRAKQQEQPGTSLPSGFPFRTRLAAVGYLAIEDLDGADADELEQTTDLSPTDLEAVMKALGVLTS